MPSVACGTPNAAGSGDSDRVARVLASILGLGPVERQRVFDALDLSVSIHPTCPDAFTAGLPWRASQPGTLGVVGIRGSQPPKADDVVGCPRCRRPVFILESQSSACVPEVCCAQGLKCAYAAVSYGSQCHTYFLGALVLGWGLVVDERKACRANAAQTFPPHARY